MSLESTKPDIIFLREIQYLSVRNIFVRDRYVSPKLRVGSRPTSLLLEGEEAGRGRVFTYTPLPPLHSLLSGLSVEKGELLDQEELGRGRR